MSLGRFAAYFCALAVVGLIAFPRAMGSISPRAVPVESALPYPDAALTADSLGVRRAPVGLRVRCDVPPRQAVNAVKRFTIV